MIQKSTHAIPRMDLAEAFHEYSPRRARFIADLILPTYPTAKQAATLSVVMRENLTIPEVDHANGAVFNRVSLYMDDMAYNCKDKGLEGQVTDWDLERFATEFDAEVETSQSVKIKMMLAREKRIHDLIFNTTTWPVGTAALYTDNSGNPWDAAGTDIIGQVLAARELVRGNTGIPPNAMIIGEVTLINMLKNTGIKAQFPGAPIITEALLRAQMGALIGIQDLFVGQAVYNSADEGQTFAKADIWPDDYAMVAVLGEENLPPTEPQLGRTILWNPYTSDLEYVESYREEQTKSEIVRVEHAVDEKIFDAYFGHLMKIDA